MTSNMELKYEKHELEDYIMEMLTLGTCSLFLPVAFIQTEGEVIASYRTEGYGRLNSLQEISTERILHIVLSLLAGVDDAQRHYIFPERYVINDEAIFVQEGLHQTKAIFLPQKKEIPLADKVADLLEELKERGPEEGREYVEEAIALIRQDAFGSKAVIHHLEKLRKEVCLCDVK